VHTKIGNFTYLLHDVAKT